MRLSHIPVYVVARCCEAGARFFASLSSFFDGLLPALLSPQEITSRVIRAYDTVYTAEATVRARDVVIDESLDAWEASVLDSYKICSGRMLVLGSGWGREAFAIARRGVTVVGIDANAAAVRAAQTRATAIGVPARFHQGNFIHLPYQPRSFEWVFLASIMYSAVPGRNVRQAWLRSIRQCLTQDGLVILSFTREYSPPTRARTLLSRFNALLRALPGANAACQAGDRYATGHFLHVFQSEDDIRNELTEAGAMVKELSWVHCYAVVSFPSREHHPSA
jgi:ubiquinone/menaquinone biosynthesis C-methylase UbiE